MADVTRTENSSQGQEGPKHDADVDSLFDADTLCNANSLSNATTLCDTNSPSDPATLCDTNSLFDPATLYGDAKSKVDVAQSDLPPPETMVVIVVGGGNSMLAFRRQFDPILARFSSYSVRNVKDCWLSLTGKVEDAQLIDEYYVMRNWLEKRDFVETFCHFGRRFEHIELVKGLREY